MFLFKVISTCLEANDRIFGVCRARIENIQRLPGVNPKYSAIGMPCGISKRYRFEEKHIIYPYSMNPYPRAPSCAGIDFKYLKFYIKEHRGPIPQGCKFPEESYEKQRKFR
jgi:hypothetical protein